MPEGSRPGTGTQRRSTPTHWPKVARRPAEIDRDIEFAPEATRTTPGGGIELMVEPTVHALGPGCPSSTKSTSSPVALADALRLQLSSRPSLVPGDARLQDQTPVSGVTTTSLLRGYIRPAHMEGCRGSGGYLFAMGCHPSAFGAGSCYWSGPTGAWVAIELTDHGAKVDLSTATGLHDQASLDDEGKVHLGYVHANDRSMRTTAAMVEERPRSRPICSSGSAGAPSW